MSGTLGGPWDQPNGKCDRGWDDPETHRQLAWLTWTRAGFRSVRTLARLRSPRRIVATSLAIVFFALYLLNGIFILSTREPADPERLRLWLSGGMVIYAIYHCLRCAWSTVIADLELTPAEELWLAGAPIRRSSLAVYHLNSIIVASALKTGLLAVVLVRDVEHLELLLIGIFGSLLLLECTRLIVGRLAAGLSVRGRNRFRLATTAIATALALQVIARIFSITPPDSPTWLYVLSLFQSLGLTAASDMIQCLSLPWIVPASIAVSDSYGWHIVGELMILVMLIPAAIVLLVRIDAWASNQRLQREQACLRSGDFQCSTGSSLRPLEIGSAHPLRRWLDQRLPSWTAETMAVISRQAISIRRYKGTIAMSFVIPIVLCLSPLFTGQVTQQWFFVVGGIAMCTMLLAPPALRIDFRRDLPRMLLLRSLPIKPLSMVMGQLTLPILITCLFQWITIVVAAMIVGPGLIQVSMWTGMLTALAVFTFAAENALFLAYPHHQHNEGVAMMIRAKLTFMGKATVIAVAVGCLGGWAMACQRLPEAWIAPTLVIGAIAGCWTLAAIAIAACTMCWRRFDLALDVPPE